MRHALAGLAGLFGVLSVYAAWFLPIPAAFWSLVGWALTTGCLILGFTDQPQRSLF